MTADLRLRLRKDTRVEHERVEAEFARLDLNDPVGLQCTVRAHARALARLLPSLAPLPEMRREAERLHALALQAAEGITPDEAQPVPEGQTLHPLAVAYVILGSRLGARVIAAELNRDNVRSRPKDFEYFVDDNSRPAWSALLQLLDSCTDATDLVVADATAAFGVFGSEARRAFEEMQRG